eukprot:819613-Pleurochrysis_carterae.AAC.1
MRGQVGHNNGRARRRRHTGRRVAARRAAQPSPRACGRGGAGRHTRLRHGGARAAGVCRGGLAAHTQGRLAIRRAVPTIAASG